MVLWVWEKSAFSWWLSIHMSMTSTTTGPSWLSLQQYLVASDRMDNHGGAFAQHSTAVSLGMMRWHPSKRRCLRHFFPGLRRPWLWKYPAHDWKRILNFRRSIVYVYLLGKGHSLYHTVSVVVALTISRDIMTSFLREKQQQEPQSPKSNEPKNNDKHAHLWRNSMPKASKASNGSDDGAKITTVSI